MKKYINLTPDPSFEYRISNFVLNFEQLFVQYSIFLVQCSIFKKKMIGVSLKKLSFLIILFSISNLLFAQSPNIAWEKTIGNSKNDEAHKVILTSDNHYLLIGYSQPEGRYDLDLFISKINSKGEIVWKKNYGTKQVEIGYDITEDTEGNFIAVGRAIMPTRSSEIWVLKIDKDGQHLWDKKYGLKNEDAGKSIFLTKDSQIVIGGEQEGKITSVNHALWLVLDRNGNKLKEQTYGGDYFHKIQKKEDREMFGVQNVKGESCNKLIPSHSGGFLFAGNTMTKARKDLATDGWLVKLDEQGQLLWDKAFGAIGGDNLFDILENKKGEIFTIGINYDKPKGLYSFWLSKFDASGNLIFEKKYGEKNFNTAKAGLLLENDNVLICGFEASRSPSNIRTVNPDTLSQQQINQLIDEGWQQLKFKGYDNEEWKSIFQKEFPLTPEQEKIRTDRDAWLGQTDANGNLLWKKSFGGTDDDEFFSMIKDHEGNLIMVGYTRSKGNGLKDIWIVKLKFERA